MTIFHCYFYFEFLLLENASVKRWDDFCIWKTIYWLWNREIYLKTDGFVFEIWWVFLSRCPPYYFVLEVCTCISQFFRVIEPQIFSKVNIPLPVCFQFEKLKVIATLSDCFIFYIFVYLWCKILWLHSCCQNDFMAWCKYSAWHHFSQKIFDGILHWPLTQPKM